ncbi:MAG: Hpt domain-containing protein [Candidatus Riflebacteria bacterium]|nr:Hpt domain-containing protein [Candidatus Riflebacteria bacterium]
MLEEYRKAFREEINDLLASLEDTIMALEATPDDKELMVRMFRTMHTIKGSSAMFGFEDVCAFTQEFEAVYDIVRRGKGRISHDLIDLSLTAKDLIHSMIEASFGAEIVDEKRKAALVAALNLIVSQPHLEQTEDLPLSSDQGSESSVLPLSDQNSSDKENIQPQKDSKADEKNVPTNTSESSSTSAPTQAPSGIATSDGETQEAICIRIFFKPDKEIFRHGVNPIWLVKDLSEQGDCIPLANSEEVPLLEEIIPDQCYLSWNFVLHTKKPINLIRDVFIFVESDSILKICKVDNSLLFDQSVEYKRLGQILMDRGDLTKEELEKVLCAKKKISEILSEPESKQSSKIETSQIQIGPNEKVQLENLIKTKIN